jgi:histidinol dehydrogenase
MHLIKKEEIKNILEYRKKEEIESESIVREIIEDIKKYGDEKIIYYTKKYDKAEINNISLNEKELKESFKSIPEEMKDVISRISKRIRKYHNKQKIKEFSLKEVGLKISFKVKPLDFVGVYIPAGQNPLISTVLMSVIPAQCAGVKKIIACSPPSYNNEIHPYISGTLYSLGIKDVFRIGGAQAIAAMAYGTETIPKVEKIVGPGNIYVNTAKKLVSESAGIDLLAGPSELVVISDEKGNPEFISADLNAQTEHRNGFGFLITTSKSLGEKISENVENGWWIKVKDVKEALEVNNIICPEHLQIILKDQHKIIENIKAGAIFIGNYSPAAAGDYFMGPSHILPTSGRACFESGLSVFSFLRTFAVMEGGKDFFKKYGCLGEYIADREGLNNHKFSLQKRRKN